MSASAGERAIISTYPPGYERGGEEPTAKEPPVLCADKFGSDNTLRITGSTVGLQQFDQLFHTKPYNIPTSSFTHTTCRPLSASQLLHQGSSSRRDFSSAPPTLSERCHTTLRSKTSSSGRRVCLLLVCGRMAGISSRPHTMSSITCGPETTVHHSEVSRQKDSVDGLLQAALLIVVACHLPRGGKRLQG